MRATGKRQVFIADLLALRVADIWRSFRDENVAFKAMCLYLVVEYVRPQQMVPGLSVVPLGQITLGLALAALFMSGRMLQLKGVGTGFFLLFTAIILASSLTAFDSSASFTEFRQVWLGWVIIYLLIINVVNTEKRFILFLMLWLLCHYYMSQGGFKQFAGRGFRFASWGITGQPGWFGNSGEFGIAMCMLTAVSWHYYLATRQYLTRWRKVFVAGMPFTAIFGVIGCSSRGAVLGVIGIGAYEMLRSKHRVRSTLGALTFAGAVWLILPPEQKARFSSAGEDETSTLRIAYWKAGLDMARNHPALGIGYGNWIGYYRRFYAAESSGGKVQVSHNIFIQCMAELGYIGLLVLVTLIVCTLLINHQTRKLGRAGHDPPNSFILHMSYGLDGAMISYIIAGFFVTVLYYPFFWVNLALTVALNAIARQTATGTAGTVGRAGRGSIRRRTGALPQ